MEASAETTTETAREALSTHRVVAKFAGFEAGRESMLRIFPQRPAKQWAVFSEVRYEAYEKPGKYGDAQAVDTFKMCPVDQPAWVRGAVAELVAGARVRLAWSHDYVTRESAAPDGRVCTSKSPERIVSQLTLLAPPSLSPPLPLTGVVFDMDGTLLDSETMVNEVWFELLRSELGLIDWDATQKKSFADEICGVVDVRVGEVLAERYPAEVAAAGYDAATLVARKRAAYFDALAAASAESIELYPGAYVMVETMVQREGVKAALCTSSFKRKTDALLAATGLDALLPPRLRIVQEDVTGCTKPAPEPYLRAAALLGLPPSACLAVEDSPSGVRSAVAAGFAQVVGILSSHSEETLRDAGATQIVPDAAAAGALLEELVIG